MNASGKSRTILLTIIGFIWAGLGIVCLGLAFFFLAFYDSPIDPKAGMGVLDYAFIGSVFVFPVFCLISSFGIWVLKNRSKGLAIFVALLPLLPLSFVAIMFARPTSSLMNDSENVQVVSECESPVPDIGDGLETTRCSSLQAGSTVSGTLNDTSEAHNWQFTSDGGPIKISVENDGNSCPYLLILDSKGNVAEKFEVENSLRLCPSGLTTTGFFQFDPVDPGTYFIRVFSPESSGDYWLKIE